MSTNFSFQLKKLANLSSRSTLNSSNSNSNEENFSFSPQTFLHKTPVKIQEEKSLAYSKIFRNGSMKDLHKYYNDINYEENYLRKSKKDKKNYPISDIRTKIQKLSKQLSSEISGFSINRYSNLVNLIKTQQKEKKENINIKVISNPLLYTRSFSTGEKREKKTFLNIKKFTEEIKKNLFGDKDKMSINNISYGKKTCLY